MTYTMYHVHNICVCVHIYRNVFVCYGCNVHFYVIGEVLWECVELHVHVSQLYVGCECWSYNYIKCMQLLALSLSPIPTFQLVDKVDNYGSIQLPGWTKINVNSVIYYYGIVTLLYYCNSGQHYLTWSSLLTQSNWMFIQPLLCESMTMWHRLNWTV